MWTWSRSSEVVPLSSDWPLLPPCVENNYFTELCSGSEAGSYSRLIDFVYHSTLGVRVIKKKTCVDVQVEVVSLSSDWF